MKRFFGIVLWVMAAIMILSGCSSEKKIQKEIVGLWWDSSTGIVMDFSKDDTLTCYQEKASGQCEMFFTGNWKYDGRAITMHIVDVDDGETGTFEGVVITDIIHVEIDGVQLSLVKKDT